MRKVTMDDWEWDEEITDHPEGWDDKENLRPDWTNLDKKAGKVSTEPYDVCMKRFLHSWGYDMGWDHDINNKMDEDH